MLTKYNGQTITYDQIGNPLNYRDGITMNWQNGRELATYEKGNIDVTYTYDPNGLRTRKQVLDGFILTDYNYVYENGLLVQMTYGNHIYNFSYDANGTPVSLNHIIPTSGLNEYYYYGVNSRGDVEALYYGDGSLYATYDYDAYGKLLGITSYSGSDLTNTDTVANNNPLRYRSYVYDLETGLYYLQSRYYDPTTCRFVNADGYVSTGQGITGNNMFAYCNNNPVMYSDPAGYCLKAWAEGYQGPCPGLGKPGCMDYNKPSDPMTYITKRDVTQEVNDALLPEAITGKIISEGIERIENDYDKAIVQAGVLYYFKTQVDHKAPWDIKRKDPWELTIGTPYPGSSNTKVIYNGHIMTLEALGNYTYGYLGRAYGISLEVLLVGSYYAAGFPTEGDALFNEINVDWNYVTMGFYGQ